MKKYLKFFILLSIIVSLFSLSAYAADSIGIDNIVEDNKTVTVNFNVYNLKDYEDVTILVFKKTDEKSEPDKTNLVYINQLHPTDSKITFKLPANYAEGVYEVRMGGTNIQTASIGSFEILNVMLAFNSF